MISYELALKLKEAGFPQKNPFHTVCQRKGCNNPIQDGLICQPCDDYWYHIGSRNHPKDCHCTGSKIGQCPCAHMDIKKEEPVSFPTLSELIKTLGGDLWSVCRMKWLDGSGIQWQAYASPAGSIDCSGNTLEEALSNLWLALHGK